MKTLKHCLITPLTIICTAVAINSFADNSGYYSNQNDNEESSFSVNIPNGPQISFPANNQRQSYYVSSRNSRYEPQWIDFAMGKPIPSNTVIGGFEKPNRTLYVCRAPYNGGMHPGKIVSQKCHISWGGNEIIFTRYQLLVSNQKLKWIPGSNGSIPANAVPGGNERNRTLYICQARYKGGIHPGKLVGNNCNIAWGGNEVAIPYYNILTR